MGVPDLSHAQYQPHPPGNFIQGKPDIISLTAWHPLQNTIVVSKNAGLFVFNERKPKQEEKEIKNQKSIVEEESK